ncbi:MAG: hypothetical protein U5K76_10330 [Woeseiaceae bacterium]|nr:hypothetical protein [Woeseiaceae bacterium]
MNFFCFWTIQIPLAYVLATTARLKLGPEGVFRAIVISEIPADDLRRRSPFHRGGWRTQQV